MDKIGMKYQNLKVRKYMTALLLTSTFSMGTLTGCGNQQVFGLNHEFNVALETNNDNVSVTGIKQYSDYDGTQVRFITEDDLCIRSSTHQTQLIKAENEKVVENYALALSGNHSDNVIYYDVLQGTSIDFSDTGWNKEILDFHCTYNKAIILSGENAVIVPIDSWTNYVKDDKVQLVLTDGTCIFTDIDRVKLVNDENASKSSLRNYVLTLVGNEENIVHYDVEKAK